MTDDRCPHGCRLAVAVDECTGCALEERMRLRAEVAALRKLAEYAQHGVTCILRVLGHGELGAACDCGLDAALRDDDTGRALLAELEALRAELAAEKRRVEGMRAAASAAVRSCDYGVVSVRMAAEYVFAAVERAARGETP